MLAFLTSVREQVNAKSYPFDFQQPDFQTALKMLLALRSNRLKNLQGPDFDPVTAPAVSDQQAHALCAVYARRTQADGKVSVDLTQKPLLLKAFLQYLHLQFAQIPHSPFLKNEYAPDPSSQSMCLKHLVVKSLVEFAVDFVRPTFRAFEVRDPAEMESLRPSSPSLSAFELTQHWDATNGVMVLFSQTNPSLIKGLFSCSGRNFRISMLILLAIRR